MSEILTAAAAALGLPESLVQRSAEARAAETGSSVDEILAAWAGGAPAPTPATPVEEPAEPTTADETVDEVEAPPAPSPAPAPVTATDVAEPPPPLPTGPVKPPTLVGASDNPMTVLAAAVGLFLIIALVGVVGASLQVDTPGARTSRIDFSELAEEGRGHYLSLGCAACHTQMVRPIVADVGLGGVTLNDTNQVLGTRRFGPDLADVGSRLPADQIQATIGGQGGHPPHSLSDDDLAALVAYLTESISGSVDDEVEG